MPIHNEPFFPKIRQYKTDPFIVGDVCIYEHWKVLYKSC